MARTTTPGRMARTTTPGRMARTTTPGRMARTTTPGRSTMLTKFTREARERLGPEATERQIARAAEAARKAFYKRLSAAGVAARKEVLHEALMRQRRSALDFAGQARSPGHRVAPAGSADDAR
jgi:hypothetical protein